MTQRDHPLDHAFQVDSDHKIELDDDDSIKVPDDPGLNDVIQYALKAYKDQMDIMELIEPKNKLRAYETAEKYLNQAKDAIHKKEQLEIQRMKAQSSTNGSKKLLQENTDDTEGDGTQTDRKELYDKVRRVK
jgi:hypothetical protein